MVTNKVAFRQKGITDLHNLQYKYAININKDHDGAMQDKSVFKRNLGQFTHVSNEAKRFG